MGWCCVLLLLLLVFALDLFITKTISRKWHKIWLSSYNLMSIVFCYSLCLCFVCLLSVFFLSLHRIHHTKLDWMTKSFIVVGCFFFIFWCAKITHKKLWPRYKKNWHHFLSMRWHESWTLMERERESIEHLVHFPIYLYIVMHDGAIILHQSIPAHRIFDYVNAHRIVRLCR